MPAIPFIIKTILTTLGGSLFKLATKWATKLLTGPAFEELMIELAEEGAKRTDTKLDDKAIELLKEQSHARK